MCTGRGWNPAPRPRCHGRSAPAGRPPATSSPSAIAMPGSDRIRFKPYQKLILLDVADDMVDDLVARLDALGVPSLPSHWRKNLMACTGFEVFKLSFAETRKGSQVLVPELERRLEDINAQLDVPITININRLRPRQ